MRAVAHLGFLSRETFLKTRLQLGEDIMLREGMPFLELIAC